MRTRTFMKSAFAAAVALSTVMTLAAPSLAAARHHRSAPGYAYGRVDHPGILHPTPRHGVFLASLSGGRSWLL